MSGKTGKKHLSNKDYETIKLLKEAGVATKMIKDITGRSASTICLIAKSESFEDYRLTLAASRKPKTLVPPLQEPEIDNKISPLTLDIKNNTELILDRLGNVENAVNILLEIWNEKQSNERVNKWRFGSRK